MNKPDIIVALDMVIESFEKLRIPYYIAGSVASSAYGLSRTTVDVDLVADIRMEQVTHLANTLKKDYYIEPDAIRDAISTNASFNLIHLDTMIKIDVFIPKPHSYDSTAMARRQPDTLDEESSRKFYLSSPEDVILSKLQWYRTGGQVSEQQWKDILGVIKVQGGKLDLEYLRQWASSLNLSDLLNRSFVDAGITES